MHDWAQTNISQTSASEKNKKSAKDFLDLRQIAFSVKKCFDYGIADF